MRAEVRAGDLALTFDGGAVSELRVAGRAWRRGAPPAYRDFCSLTLLTADGGRVHVRPARIAASGVETDLQLDSTEVVDPAGRTYPVATQVRLRAQAGALVCTAQVVNGSEVAVDQVTLLGLDGLEGSARGADDELLLPFHAGERIPVPARSLSAMADGTLSGVARGRDRVRTRDGRHRYALRYCGDASMRWLALTSADGALYVGSHDASFGLLELQVDTDASVPAGIGLALSAWVGVRPGESWTSPAHVLAAEPDWRACADRYRRWLTGQVPSTAPVPGPTGGWAVMMKGQSGPPATTFDQLPTLGQQLRSPGMDLMCVYGWGAHGHDRDFPEFHPDLDLGGPVRMAKAQQALRAQGYAVMTYLNARIMNETSTYREGLGEHWAVRDPSGAVQHEVYGTERFRVLCPGAPGWRALLTDLGATLVELGTSVVYFDQVASAPPLPCYATGHDHAGPGEWNAAYLDLLRATAAELGDAATLFVEGCSDLYAPWAPLQEDVVLLNAGDAFGFPELLRYTLPWVRLVDLVHNLVEPPEAVFALGLDVPHAVARRQLRRAVALGVVPVALSTLAADPAWLVEVRALLELRHEASSWVDQAVFRDVEGVLDLPAGLTAYAHVGDGGLTLGLWADGTSPAGTLRIRVQQKVRGCTLLDATGRRHLPGARRDGELSVALPPVSAAFLHVDLEDESP